MLKKILKKLQKDESGQSLVELALILPILILLLTVPVDYFRYINTKMILSSAASESIGQLNYASADPSVAETNILNNVDVNYKDRLDKANVNVIGYQRYLPETNDYDYMVYRSDWADPDPDKYGTQFQPRDSNYKRAAVEFQLTYEMTPITFWGAWFLGPTFTVTTPMYTRDVYAGGYVKP